MKFGNRFARSSGRAKVAGVAVLASVAFAGALTAAPAAFAKALVPVKFTGPANPPPGVKPDPSGFIGYAISLGDATGVLKPYGFSYGGYIPFENTTEADAAVQSGSAQIVAQGQAPAILAKAGGDSVTVLSAVAVPDTTWVVVPKGSSITNIKQLVGKTVGAGFGTNFEQGFLWGLKQQGISLTSVHLANIVVNEGEASLANKTDGISAFATSTQLGQLWAADDTPIWKSQSYPADKAVQISLVSSSFAKKYPLIQQAWWALYQAGEGAYKDDPAKYFAWAGKQGGITGKQAQIADPVVVQTTPIEPSAVPVLKSGLSFFLQVGQAQNSFNINNWLIAPAGTIKQ